MSDKLAPLLEREGPWLLQVGSTNEDPQCWAAYVKLSEQTRSYLRTIRHDVERLHTANPTGFYAITYWSVGDLRFLSEGVYGKPDLGEYVEPITTFDVDQLIVPAHLIGVVENLEALRTDCAKIHCNIDGVSWSAADHYCSAVYNTNTLRWSDI